MDRRDLDYGVELPEVSAEAARNAGAMVEVPESKITLMLPSQKIFQD